MAMTERGWRGVRWLALMPIVLATSACVKITSPASGSTVNLGFTVSVALKSQYCSGFKVTLDGADVTSQFTAQPPATMTPSAQFAPLSNGPHTLVATASTKQYWTLAGSCATSTDTSKFNVLHRVGK